MFMFVLARDLGKTVSELASSMTSEEFTYWMAFYSHQNKQLENSTNGKNRTR